jgi:hypothetical protein
MSGMTPRQACRRRGTDSLGWSKNHRPGLSEALDTDEKTEPLMIYLRIRGVMILMMRWYKIAACEHFMAGLGTDGSRDEP